MSDTSLVRVQLNDNNSGAHPIYGPATRTYYGYRAHGDYFRVHPADAAVVVPTGAWIAGDEPPAGVSPADPPAATAGDSIGAEMGVGATAVVEAEAAPAPAPAARKRTKR